MIKRKLPLLALAIVCVTTLVLLIGCPQPSEKPMSIYRGTVYGATPYFKDVELSSSEAYYFEKNDVITINYTLTAEDGKDYKTYKLSVGALASKGGLFKIVDFVRDPSSIENVEVLSKNERFAIVRSKD